MQVLFSTKQHRKYDSGYQKRRKKQKIDEPIESQKQRFYFNEWLKNKFLQVNNRYGNFRNISLICYLLLLFDFTMPLGPRLSISHLPLILSGRPY